MREFLGTFLNGLIFVLVAFGVLILIAMNPGSTLSYVLIIGSIIFAYFLPTIVAAARKHNNEGAIFALNLLLGWTFLGWVAALVWALTDNTRKPRDDDDEW